jgi:hypothetical protein
MQILVTSKISRAFRNALIAILLVLASNLVVAQDRLLQKTLENLRWRGNGMVPALMQ